MKLILGTERLYRNLGFVSDVSRNRSRLCSSAQRQYGDVVVAVVREECMVEQVAPAKSSFSGIHPCADHWDHWELLRGPLHFTKAKRVGPEQ